MLFAEALVSADLGSRVVAVTVLNARAFVIANSLAVALRRVARRGLQAFRVAGKAAVRAAESPHHAVMPGGTIGPACAAEPATVTNANAEIATADAIANL